MCRWWFTLCSGPRPKPHWYMHRLNPNYKTVTVPWSSVNWHMFIQHLLLALDRHLLECELVELDDLDHIVAPMSHSIQQVIIDDIPSKRICQSSRMRLTPELIALKKSCSCSPLMDLDGESSHQTGASLESPFVPHHSQPSSISYLVPTLWEGLNPKFLVSLLSHLMWR